MSTGTDAFVGECELCGWTGPDRRNAGQAAYDADTHRCDIDAEAIERAAEAMWTLIAERMEDPERSVCRGGPSEREPVGRQGVLRWRAQRWDESSGAWRSEMLDMARVALAAASDKEDRHEG